MVWNEQQINQHKQAAFLLDRIKDETFALIKATPNITEYAVQQFMLEQFVQHQLITDQDLIAAFAENTSFVHYFPKPESKQLQPENLIMIDLWASLDEETAPFADITWMAYSGQQIDPEIAKVVALVFKARDMAIKYIRKQLKNRQLPVGKAIDDVVRDVFATANLVDKFLHNTGHSLGFDSPHGKEFGINQKNDNPLSKNLAYTIEPGIYLEGRFGVRSEIDFFIDDNLQLIITTEVQKELIII